ncbi:hypothetical protein FRC04_003349 [Tulasnella sp. 424]|nr:hypothetical protein FRC04_003349 [Tulasnella sp. 424]
MLRDVWTTTTATFFVAFSILSSSTLVLGSTIHLDERAPSSFSSCLTASKVKTLTSSSSGYTTAALAFNRRLSYKPAAIVYPMSKTDVSAVVKCAADSGVPVVARSGGHSYAAYGLGGKDGALVVDLSSMKSLSLDSSTHLLASQTGNRLGDVAQYLWDNGKRALPHGTCPYVGTGGHTSYGGFGLYGRTAGLLLDRVVSADVVIANGTVLTASNTSHSDLFWALRGAAPSYGIVTSWTFSTLAAPSTLTNYWYTFSSTISNANAVSLIMAFQNFAATNPTKQLAAILNVGVSDGHMSIQMSGTYYGSKTDFTNAIKPLQDAFPANVGMKLTTKNRDWYTGLTDFTGPLSTSGPDVYDTFFAKSVVSATAYSKTSVTNWVNYMIQQDKTWGSKLWWWVEVDMYGGVISQVAETATAYTHRSATLNFQFYGGTPDDGKDPWVGQGGIDFMNGLVSSLVANPTGAYPNYIDPTLTADQWHSLYFAGNFQRLTQLKKAWDPKNVFNFPQSIPLAA